MLSSPRRDSARQGAQQERQVRGIHDAAARGRGEREVPQHAPLAHQPPCQPAQVVPVAPDNVGGGPERDALLGQPQQGFACAREAHPGREHAGGGQC